MPVLCGALRNSAEGVCRCFIEHALLLHVITDQLIKQIHDLLTLDVNNIPRRCFSPVSDRPSSDENATSRARPRGSAPSGDHFVPSIHIRTDLREAGRKDDVARAWGAL